MHDIRGPHAWAALTEWRAMRTAVDGKRAPPLNGNHLSIAHVIAVCCHGATAQLSNAPEDLDRVNQSVAFLESELAAGHVIYGVNTGFGGSADTRTQDFERLQSAAIQHLNVGVLLQSDKGRRNPRHENDLLRSHALPTPIVKAAMLIRCNSLMRGHSGVRVSVIDSIMQLLAQDMTPIVPLRGSISASGDLSTLSYIAGAIEGNPDVFIKIAQGGRPGYPAEKSILPASEVLPLAGLSPVRLHAKEGLGITNGTAPSCAAASIVMHQANQLALLTQLLTAMGTEALAGTAHNYDPFISAIRPHTGQTEAAANILKFLSGSKLSPARGPDHVGLAQDRYALRTAPQWIGPQLEDLMLATRQVEIELNSTTDNPLIDVAAGRVHHGGNFQAAAITSAMEKTMTALQNLGRLLFAQSSEIINNMTNKGLPPNLSADEPSESFTFKGFDVNMAAYMAELAYLARPISTHVQVAEMTNQSVNSMALASARYALEAVEVLSLMAATYICTLCQALDLRCLQREFGVVARRSLVDAGLETLEATTGNTVDDKCEALLLEWADGLIQRWDQLSHVDTRERSKTVARDSTGALMECLEKIPGFTADVALLNGLREKAANCLQSTHDTLKARLFYESALASETTSAFLSPASRVVYEFVRKELKVPLNRGVADHPPLLLRSAKEHTNGMSNGVKKDDLRARGRILGTMASEIYEALRSGELHDRIMTFAEETGLWEQ